MGYELLDHTGDIAILVREPELDRLFVTAAQGMFAIMVKGVEGGEESTVEAEGVDSADLLRNFLGDLLYNFSAEGTILAVDSVVVNEGTRLTARGRKRTFDPKNDELETELKAVTYHQLEVAREGDAWMARVIFDV